MGGASARAKAEGQGPSPSLAEQLCVTTEPTGFRTPNLFYTPAVPARARSCRGHDAARLPDARLLVRQNGRAGMGEGLAVLVFSKHLAKFGHHDLRSMPSTQLQRTRSHRRGRAWYQPQPAGSTWQRPRASPVVRPEGYLSSSIQASTTPLSSHLLVRASWRSGHRTASVGVTKSPRFPSSPSEEKGAAESGGWRSFPSPGKFSREVADSPCRTNV